MSQDIPPKPQYRPRLPKETSPEDRKRIHRKRHQDRRREALKRSPEKRRAHHLRKQYGLSWIDAVAMYQGQHGKCAICGKEITLLMTDQKSVACLDHCHSTGKPRGFLCDGCNTGLGGFRDTPEFMLKAILYLSKS